MRRREGFSLLETLIALVILVLGISSILPLFAVGSASHRRGMDQASVSWIAPRVAARLQEGLADRNPRDVEGYVKEGPDGSVLISDEAGKLRGGEGATYRFRATFQPVGSVDARDPTANTAFVLRVEVKWLGGAENQSASYETVVLRRLDR